MKRVIFLCIPALFFIVGCATAPPALEQKEVKEIKDVAAPAVKPVAEAPKPPPSPLEERELLLDGVALLNRPGGPDAEKARSTFVALIQRYPQGLWRPSAEAFIRLIDERDAFGEMSRQDRLLVEKGKEERSKALQEIDHLKRAVREMTEKLQSETAALKQENEQLKKDIQRLKILEIELQKREKMLR